MIGEPDTGPGPVFLPPNPIQIEALTPEDVGRGVLFHPHHGGKPERGVLSSWNANYVFARFTSGSTAAACDPAQLAWEHDMIEEAYEKLPEIAEELMPGLVAKIMAEEQPPVAPIRSRLDDLAAVLLGLDWAEMDEFASLIAGYGRVVDPRKIALHLVSWARKRQEPQE